MKKLYTITLALILILQSQVLMAQKPVDPSTGFVLKNDRVIFAFEPVNMGLSSMIDRSTNFNHIEPINGKHLLWEIAFAKGNQIYSITNNYKPCSYASLTTLPDGTSRAVMEWNRLRWWEEDNALSVTVTIELPKDSGIARWRIFVENNSNYWGLWSVLFPIVNGFPASGKYEIARPSAESGGELLKACDQRLSGWYPGGDWPMQMVSYNQSGNSVYLASKDPEVRAKEFVVEPIKGLDGQRYPILFIGRNHRKFDPEPGERSYLLHYPNDMGVQGSDYPDPYPVEFGVHRGGWTEAARIYRGWVLQQRWTQKGALSARRDIPEGILKLGVWLKEEGFGKEATASPEEMNKPLLEAAKMLDVPVGLYCSNPCLPPFNAPEQQASPASTAFGQRVAGLKAQNILVVPSIDRSGVEMNSPDFNRLKTFAVKDEAEGLRVHAIPGRPGRFFSMCGSQAPWQDEVEKLTGNLKKQFGLPGISVDQLSSPSLELCFDPAHLHPLGGGSYWARGSRELLQKVKNVALRDGGSMVVTSGGASEVLFDLTDANLLRAQPSGNEIPLVQMVYSGYALFFGSNCDYTQSDDYFRYAQGHALIDGRQNGWMDPGLLKPEYRQKAEFLKRCGKYRQLALNYLVYGRLLDPVVPVEKMSTFSDGGFAPGRQEKQGGAEVPSAEARLWRSEEGTLAVFLVNYTGKKVDFKFRLNPGDYGLEKGKWQIKGTGSDASVKLGEFTGTLNRTEALEPGSIKMIELIPSR